MFLKVLFSVKKNLSMAITVSMLLGFIYGLIFSSNFLSNLIMPFTFLMIFPMMIDLDFMQLLNIKNYKLHIITQIINFLIIPIVAYGLGFLFFKDQNMLFLGLFLSALLPTSGMTITWTGFANGNINASVIMTLIGLLLGSIATPFYIKFFMGTAVEFSLVIIFKQIFLVIFLPLILGQLTKYFLLKSFDKEKFNKNFIPKISSVSILGVLGIVFVAIALKSKIIYMHPELLIKIIVPVILFYIINFMISFFAAKMFFDKYDGSALIYGSVMRNLSIALAIAMTTFGPNAGISALIISVAFIIQVQFAAISLKFVKKIL